MDQPSSKPTIVYACSGCSDTGEIADRVARRLNAEGVAEMSCLAGIGGRVKALLAKAERAGKILVVDGCPLSCAKRTMELAGFREFDYLNLSSIGMRKNSCPVTEDAIARGAAAAKEVLAREVLETATVLTGGIAASLALMQCLWH